MAVQFLRETGLAIPRCGSGPAKVVVGGRSSQIREDNAIPWRRMLNDIVGGGLVRLSGGQAAVPYCSGTKDVRRQRSAQNPRTDCQGVRPRRAMREHAAQQQSQ